MSEQLPAEMQVLFAEFELAGGNNPIAVVIAEKAAWAKSYAAFQNDMTEENLLILLRHNLRLYCAFGWADERLQDKLFG
jgi:hypothetical protein